MARTGGHRSRLLDEMKSLSDDRVRALADFAAYLREREEWETTAEILGDKAMAGQIRRSRKAWAAGKKEAFLSLDEVKATLNV